MTIMPFRFLKIDTVQNLVHGLSGKNITYRPPKLRKGNKEWYIEYYFHVPEKLRHLLKNKVWEKFRVFYRRLSRNNAATRTNVAKKGSNPTAVTD